MKRVAIVQSCYLPWKGFFDLIHRVDEFILYDDVQFTRRDWRNRNRLKGPDGPQWITVPVKVKGRFLQRIRDTEVMEGGWAEKHWQTIHHFYARAPFFAEVGPRLRELYERAERETHLSAVNRLFLEAICSWLGIGTRLRASMEFPLVDGKSERLLDLCRQVGADEYLSGPAARDYLDEGLFARAGVRVSWMDYHGYPEYRQLHAPPFVHEVSIVDLLCNEGLAAAPRFMLSFSGPGHG